MPQREIEIGQLPPTPLPASLLVRPDRSGLALIVPGGGETMRVFRLEAQGERLESEFAAIFPRSMRFSARGRLNYVAQAENGFQNVVDGVADAEIWDAISDEGGWSERDGLFWVAKKGEEHWVVTPERRFLIENKLWRHSLAWSADGRAIAWITAKFKALDARQTVWPNGQKWLEAEEILLPPTWNAGGDRLACGYGGSQGAFVRVGEKEFGPYAELGKSSLIWSQNGQVCAWFIRRGGKAHVVLNGEEKRLDFATLRGGTLSLSPDGSRFAVVAHTGFLGVKGAVVVDGVAEPSYVAVGVSPPAWTPQGDAIAYCANLSLKQTAVVCHGRVGETHRATIDGSLRWNPDGTRVSCFVQHQDRPSIAVESRDGQSATLAAENGHFFKGQSQSWPDAHTLRDIGFRADGTVFRFEATF